MKIAISKEAVVDRLVQVFTMFAKEQYLLMLKTDDWGKLEKKLVEKDFCRLLLGIDDEENVEDLQLEEFRVLMQKFDVEQGSKPAEHYRDKIKNFTFDFLDMHITLDTMGLVQETLKKEVYIYLKMNWLVLYLANVWSLGIMDGNKPVQADTLTALALSAIKNDGSVNFVMLEKTIPKLYAFLVKAAGDIENFEQEVLKIVAKKNIQNIKNLREYIFYRCQKMHLR